LTPAAIVPVPLEASHLDLGRDQVFLDVLGHLDGGAQPRMALRAIRQGLLHDSVNPLRGRSGHPRMPGFLPRTLGPPMQQGQAEELFLGRV